MEATLGKLGAYLREVRPSGVPGLQGEVDYSGEVECGAGTW